MDFVMPKSSTHFPSLNFLFDVLANLNGIDATFLQTLSHILNRSVV